PVRAPPAMYTLSLHDALPISVLITYGVMSRRNEITALKAGGISVYRAAGPVLALGAAVCLAMFGASEYVLPPMSREATRYLNIIDRKSTRLNSSHQIISYAVF